VARQHGPSQKLLKEFEEDLYLNSSDSEARYGFLHPLRLVEAWEVFSDFLPRERQIPFSGFFCSNMIPRIGIVVELSFAR